ncbi:unnamed protein product [Ceutorhynchus assimilis]|uniref:Uncharacterized protein n=1 Tax=Ceutorhynchus assimilis TaxID=467358 RepID=A0A9N9QQF1_9CUCU|nr:unnamed protein product [Ceutorhynchus assimilis]
MASTTQQCLLCNSSCLSVRNSVNIFINNSGSSDLNLATVLEEILESPLTQESVHSSIICKKCYKLVDEFDELQNRRIQIKNDIFENYQNTLEAKIEAQSAQEIVDDVPDTIVEETEIHLPSTTKVLQNGALSRNELPKKILDIPSSDDESNQVTETNFQSMEDIDMELVKMHSSPAEIDINPFANTDTEDESSTVISTTQTSFVKIKTEPTSNEEPSISNKPNILKKKSQDSITYSDNIIIQQSNDTFKNIDDASNVSCVSREGKIYTCLLCTGNETVAGEAKAIIGHVKEAHNTRLYICDVCGLDFSKRNLLSAHVDDHVANEEGDFQCEVCNRIFTNLRLFRIHRRMHLPHNKSWQCNTCGKKYSSKNLLDEHVNTHLGVRPYACSTCGKDFASKYTFKAHEKTHETRPRPFKCEQCGKAFLSQQNLSQHEKTHVGIKEYQCHLCNKTFGTTHSLEVHSLIHTGYKPYYCSLCGKSFARKAEIRDHERTHTGERPFQCEFCGATFSQRSNLQTHKRTTHYDDKRYRCDTCGKCFKRRRLLDYHLKAAHTGERPFECDICKATFIYPEHFKKHRRIHTGEKPYKCEVCDKAFVSRDNRNAHRFVHSDRKPYECLVCSAGFMRKPHLFQHMRAEGHVNDTIVINQPRLTLDEKVDIESETYLVPVEDVDSNDIKQIIGGEQVGDHIMIDHKRITGIDSSDNEENATELVEATIKEADEDDDAEEEMNYGDILTTEISNVISTNETQIIDTPDGPIQLVKVKIPNENNEIEEAWIKIVP